MMLKNSPYCNNVIKEGLDNIDVYVQNIQEIMKALEKHEDIFLTIDLDNEITNLKQTKKNYKILETLQKIYIYK